MIPQSLERGAETERWERFGVWLRAERKARRLTQQECADAAGLSLKQWSRLESGESGTKYDQIPGIAAAIGADEETAYRRAGFLPPTEEVAAGSRALPFEGPVQSAVYDERTVRILEDMAERLKRIEEKLQDS